MVYYSSIYESIECAESKTVSLLLIDPIALKRKTSKCASKMRSLERRKNNVVFENKERMKCNYWPFLKTPLATNHEFCSGEICSFVFFGF